MPLEDTRHSFRSTEAAMGNNPTIHVDLDKLEERAHELQSIQNGVRGWDDQSSIRSRFGAVGHGELHDELDHFCGGWRDGIDAIRKNLDGAIKALTGAVDQYRTADKSVTDGMVGGSSSGSPPARGGA